MTTRWGALLAAVVACGGGGSSSDSGSGTTPAMTPGTTPTVNPTAQNEITIQGMAFSPLKLEVAPGATVTVRNLDGIPHSVTSESTAGAFRPGAASGVSFDTGQFTGQRTFTIPANAPLGATIPYYCSVHLGTMATPNGEIVVTATPGSTTTGTPTTPTTPATPSTPTMPTPTPSGPY
ncbi:cupredoxin domain-containing protein [Anaeromyxobacter terrae]|uniref:cupredoxin domain-containing protein n=1 Tax=Anaeromyxobacter terrae TaxID=2925406 RepID=UPI001F5666AD|nr:plastocyanin/azurin family copper-binding protein [Anaeromyxobacter sp. SG22]